MLYGYTFPRYLFSYKLWTCVLLTKLSSFVNVRLIILMTIKTKRTVLQSCNYIICNDIRTCDTEYLWTIKSKLCVILQCKITVTFHVTVSVLLASKIMVVSSEVKHSVCIERWRQQVLQYICNYLPNHMALYPRRLKSEIWPVTYETHLILEATSDGTWKQFT
jgi:hypothetical protein